MPWIRGSEEIGVNLLLENTGSISITARGLKWRSPRPASEDERTIDFPRPVSLAPKSREIISLTIPLHENARLAELLTFHLLTGSEDRAESGVKVDPVQIPLKPPPRVDVQISGDFRLLRIADPKKGIQFNLVSLDRDLTLSHEENIVLHNIETNQTATVEREDISTRQLKVNLPIPIHVADLESFFSEGVTTRTVRLEVPIVEMGASVFTDTFTLHYIPKTEFEIYLELPEGITPRILKGCKRSFELWMKHHSRRVFSIDAIDVELPEHITGHGVYSAFIPNKPFPLMVDKAMESERLLFLGKITLDMTQWDSAGEKSEFRIHIRVDEIPEPSFTKSFPMEIVVCQIEWELPMGIDFGNTNSCVAIINDNNLPEMIPLPPLIQRKGCNKDNPIVVPTIVKYRAAGGFASEWESKEVEVEEVGGPALDALQASPQIGYKTITFFKPKIGLDFHHHFPFMPNVKNKTVDSIAYDYLKNLLTVTREETGYDYLHVILSHPVRFWTKQRLALRDALIKSTEASNINPNQLSVGFIDEASSVLLYYLVAGRYFESNSKARVPDEREIILVFDFGGGTIDMTLCEVTYDAVSERISIRHLDFDGTNDLGGEYLTEIIQKQLYRRAKNVANGREEEYQTTFPNGKNSNRREQNPSASNANTAFDARNDEFPIWSPDEDEEELLDLSELSTKSTVGNRAKSIQANPNTDWEESENEEEDAIIIPYSRIETLTQESGRYTNLATLNYWNLYWIAELLKIYIFTSGSTDEMNISVSGIEKKNPDSEPKRIQFFTDIVSKKDAIESQIKQALSGALEKAKTMIRNVKQMDSQCSLTKVLMSGQSSRMPLIQEMLRQAVLEANDGKPVEIVPLANIKEAVAMGSAIYGYMREYINVEMNRVSRVYIFLRGRIIGSKGYIPVIDRLTPLPAEAVCENFPLCRGKTVTLVESFINLQVSSNLITGKKDQEFRDIAKFQILPDGWTDEQIESARMKVILTRDEELRVTLEPNPSHGAELEPYSLWPPINACKDTILSDC